MVALACHLTCDQRHRSISTSCLSQCAIVFLLVGLKRLSQLSISSPCDSAPSREDKELGVPVLPFLRNAVFPRIRRKYVFTSIRQEMGPDLFLKRWLAGRWAREIERELGSSPGEGTVPPEQNQCSSGK